MRRRIELSERELAVAGSGGTPVRFGADYQGVLNQVSIAGSAQAVIVIVTVFFMAAHLGA